MSQASFRPLNEHVFDESLDLSGMFLVLKKPLNVGKYPIKLGDDTVLYSAPTSVRKKIKLIRSLWKWL